MAKEVIVDEFPDEIVEKTIAQKWLEVYTANYNEESEVAKELAANHTKKSFKGDPYFSWAAVERAVLMCDPSAEFRIRLNERGGLVHTDILENYQYTSQKGEVINETKTLMFSHFVVIELTFLSRHFVEHYPIQDKDYSAVRIFDQNDVNKALQRGKVRLAARGTGLGLKLYEGIDLQFDPPTEPGNKKPEVPKVPVTTQKVTTKKAEKVEEKDEVLLNQDCLIRYYGEEISTTEEVPTAQVSGEPSPDVLEVLAILRDNDEGKINTLLQRVNPQILSRYNFVLALTDTDQELIDKISAFPEPDKFKLSLLNLLGQ